MVLAVARDIRLLRAPREYLVLLSWRTEQSVLAAQPVICHDGTGAREHLHQSGPGAAVNETAVHQRRVAFTEKERRI